MSDVDKVVAEVRESFGKGAARKIRAVGKIPAVIYGHGTEPQHVTLPAHQIGLILRKTNALLDLDIAGKSELVLVKDVQKDPVRQIIEHIDLIVIKKGEKVDVEVPVHVEGEPFPGSQVDQDLHTLRLEALATAIPTSVVVSVAGLTEGAQILAKDVTLPAGSTLVEDPNALVLSIYALAAAKAEGAEAAE
ncbi:50S ribosomal protein L25/general stress protein Ctc [Microterricola pindariensis]|uniref:Large ribosomal subunit protein bL25 n=1 Tax=Microterricola pindariensis TaxID=478010 RepID=A0ABX5AU34_9MICO|nr:50S ribosomal protein L25/general stress protein Ctc [Microterricola pindariensis]PPL15815.1 50S ribosomal protein L25/general stress protein Ctc [Microterricola pindariensis]